MPDSMMIQIQASSVLLENTMWLSLLNNRDWVNQISLYVGVHNKGAVAKSISKTLFLIACQRRVLNEEGKLQ